MPFNLTEFDNNLIGQLSMKAVGVDLKDLGGFNFKNGESPFQFPPKIKGDSKSGNWQEIDVKEWEPQIIFWGANARNISLEMTYVATGHTSNDGVTWNTENISKIIKDLRGILYSSQEGAELPVWELSLYQHLPDSGGASTWRTISVSERPGDSLISIDGKVYAFRTDITLELQMVTQVDKKGEPQQRLDNLPLKPKPLWY